MNWYLKVLKNYFNFSGRARRKEYWMFALFQFIFAIVAIVIENVLGLAMKDVGCGPFYSLLILGTFIPSLAVTVRRLHDIGKIGL